jgi:hypothetical protein
MNAIASFWSVSVIVDFDVVSNFLPAMMNFSSAIVNFAAGVGFSIAFAIPIVPGSTDDISPELLANMKRWHGGITDRYENVSNVADTLKIHGDDWDVPTAMNTGMNSNKNQIQSLIDLSDSGRGSAVDRTARNALLRSTVHYCLHDVKTWAWEQYRLGVLTATDVHSLAFLLPGEIGGTHVKGVATNVLPSVKVRVINASRVRVVIDQAVDENAAQVAHGWPEGVRFALISMTSVETGEEIFHQLTTRLHNNIEMPQDSHGKQFAVQAAFLAHVNDTPAFNDGATFSMPVTTRDLIDSIHAQHEEDVEAHRRENEANRSEIEAQKQEIERLRAELSAKK